MENASKALIIAGAVLITILIITIGIYLVGQIRKSSDAYVTKLDTIELEKYNTTFEVYIGKTNISAQEIVTLISVAKQRDLGTHIIVNGHDIINEQKDDFEKWKSMFLSQNILTENAITGQNENEFYYVNNSTKYNAEGQVIEISFNKKM